MANMSYCMFQNTETDLRQCVRELEDEAVYLDEMDTDEADAVHEMKRLCERYLDAYEVLTENGRHK